MRGLADKVQLAGGLSLWAPEFCCVPNLAIACSLVNCITDLFIHQFAKYIWCVNVQRALTMACTISISWQTCDLYWWLLIAPSLIPGMALGKLSFMWSFFCSCPFCDPFMLFVNLLSHPQGINPIMFPCHPSFRPLTSVGLLSCFTSPKFKKCSDRISSPFAPLSLLVFLGIAIH